MVQIISFLACRVLVTRLNRLKYGHIAAGREYLHDIRQDRLYGVRNVCRNGSRAIGQRRYIRLHIALVVIQGAKTISS